MKDVPETALHHVQGPDVPDSRASADGRVIRPAIREDARDLLAMIHALAVHHGDKSTVTLADLHAMCFESSRNVHIWIATRRGVALGYAAAVPQVQLQFARRTLDLHHLFVIPAERGTGTGRALMTAAIAEAQRQGCAEVTVGVMPGNAQARGVYETAGFIDKRSSAQRLALELATKARPADSEKPL